MDWQFLLSILDFIIKISRLPLKWFYEAYYRYIKKEEFMFRRYSKVVRVFPDGHGIITTKMMIKVLNNKKFKKIRRNMNIEDANIDAGFDSWQNMTSTKKSERYNKLGIWWNGDDEVIKEAKPLYNSDSPDSKHLRWNFIFDDAKIRRDKIKIINLSYGLSIPKLYPIKNGKMDQGKVPYGNYIYKTGLKAKHKVTLLRYSIVMDQEMELVESPEFKLYDKNSQDNNGDGKHLAIDDQSTIFLHIYNTNVRLPKYGQRIQCKWKMR